MISLVIETVSATSFYCSGRLIYGIVGDRTTPDANRVANVVT